MKSDFNWIEEPNHFWRCPYCGSHYSFIGPNFSGYNYCPNCGADMRGEQDG